MKKLMPILLVLICVTLLFISCNDFSKNQIHIHSYNEWYAIENATCTTPGRIIGECSCGSQQEKEIKPIGHTLVVDPAVEATCTTIGLQEGQHCSRCNEITIIQTIIPAIPHFYDDQYDSECNGCGLFRNVDCAHKTSYSVKGYASTCTEKGLTDGEKCFDCEQILVSQAEIPSLGHTESDWILDREASYTTVGKMHKECTRCGDELETKETPKLELEIDGDFDIVNNGLPCEVEAYIGNQADELILTNSINIDDKYYVYYFYLGTMEMTPLYSTPAHKYTVDHEMTFEFSKLTSEQMTESRSEAIERIDTHSYTGGFSLGFEQTVDLGAKFLGKDMNLHFTTTQSTDHHWTNNWGSVVTSSVAKENNYLSQNTEIYRYTYQMSEQNGFTKGYYYRATFYESVSVYGILIYDATSPATTEKEKYTVAYETFLNSTQPTYILEESKDGRFEYEKDTVMEFDVEKAIEIASNNKPTNVEVSTSYVIHISNVYDMYLLRGKTKGKTFILDNDIDFSGISWTPIENFEGTLDGNGKSISNLQFELYDGAVGEWGLFKTISSSATIKNLTMKNCSAKYIAPGVGYAVSNVKIGFLAANNYGNITDCTFTGNIVYIDANTKVTSQYVYCGIAVCDNYGYIRNTSSTLNSIDIDCDSVSSDSADDKNTVAVAGGICAHNQKEGYVSNCTAKTNTIKTRVCYLADEGETVVSTSSGAVAWNYGHLVNNTCENNNLTAIKRYYVAKWGIFGNFKGTEYKGEEDQSCDQECTRNNGN